MLCLLWVLSLVYEQESTLTQLLVMIYLLYFVYHTFLVFSSDKRVSDILTYMAADSNTPDCVLYLLEASQTKTTSALGICDDEEFAAAVQILKRAKKAIVLVNKMYVCSLAHTRTLDITLSFESLMFTMNPGTKYVGLKAPTTTPWNMSRPYYRIMVSSVQGMVTMAYSDSTDSILILSDN